MACLLTRLPPPTCSAVTTFFNAAGCPAANQVSTSATTLGVCNSAGSFASSISQCSGAATALAGVPALVLAAVMALRSAW